jgi:hypothetical protein
MTDPTNRYIVDLCEEISDCYSIPVRVIFRNRKDAYHTRENGNSHLIVFGYQCIDWAQENYTEYKSVQWMISGMDLTGLAGVHQLVLHEMAHAIDTELHGRKYGVAHGHTWKAHYRELMELYPFEG